VDLARQLLESCRDGRDWSVSLLDRLVAQATDKDPAVALAASRSLFTDLVEPLADAFEPAFCDAYARLFARVIATVVPELDAGGLLDRYRRIRRPRQWQGDASAVRRVAVLSRVTLGADVAVTSVFLDAAKKRFPHAEVCFAGGPKGWELFAADPRLRHLPVPYGRGASLADKLGVWPELKRRLSEPASIVMDPDSRLTQLGLLPVCGEENYFFFESRAWGGESDAPLGELARHWLAEVFGVEDAEPFIAPPETPPETMTFGGQPVITASLGVGENQAKRVADPFEEELVRHLANKDALVILDQGPGGEEAQRVGRVVAACGAQAGRIQVHEGSFASFAARIARSRLYVGYDSAGQHVAAACGVPLVAVFAGHVSPRMFARWRPRGRGPSEVVRVENQDPAEVFRMSQAAIDRLWR